MSRISNAERSRRSREKQRSTLAPDLIAAKKKSSDHKRKLNQLNRRLNDKEFDEKLLKQNRERVKKFREKKRALQKENIPPSSDRLYVTNTQVQSSSVNTVTHDQFSSVNTVTSVQHSSVNLVTQVQSSSVNSVTETSSDNVQFLSSLDSTSEDLSPSSPCAGDFATPRVSGTRVKFPFSTPKSRQKEAGEKRRRETLRNKNNDIEELQNQVKNLERKNEKLEEENFGLVIENCNLKKKIKTQEDEKSEKFSWLKSVWKFCSPDLKKDFKAAVQASKDELPKGVIRGIRDHAGINFSNPLPITDSTRGTGDLKVKIHDFATKHSHEVPDKKMAKKEIRFMNHYKIVLHQQFLMENPGIDCHYTTFCANFPSHIIKPGLNSHGSCLCEDCENFSLKIEALKRYKFLEENNIDSIIRAKIDGNNVLEEDFLEKLEAIKSGDKRDSVVSYFVWKDDKIDVHGENTITTTKKMTRKNFQVTVSTLVDRIQESYEPLKQHIHRDRVIKKFIREKRQKTEEDSSMVCLTVDWSENGTLIQSGEVQSAFFGRPSYSIHSGYMYQKDNNHGFAMITDENNHKAESIWAALTPKLESLVDQGVTKFYICSDSTGAQYRNCKNAFLIKQFATKHKVTVIWIFTEKHHGKSPADGIGGNIKHQVEQLTAFSTEHNIRNALDVVTLLKSTNTTIDISHFDCEDIKKTLSLIPGELNSFRGATKYHEIFVNPTGKILVKELPTDERYGTVSITVKKKRGAPSTSMGEPVAMIDAE